MAIFKNKFLFLLISTMLILLLFSTSFVNSADDPLVPPSPYHYPYPCCVPEIVSASSDLNMITPCDAGYVEMPNCYANISGNFVLNPDAETTGCCCRQGTIFPSSPQSLLYKYVCEASPNSGIFKTARDARSCTQDLCGGTPSITPTNKWNVSGTIYWKNENQLIPLPNASLTINGSSTITPSNGTYKINDINEGTNFYTIIALEISIDGYMYKINCYPLINGELTITQNSIINFNLTCGEQGVPCTPSWTLSGWSPCQSVSGN
ncbi:MAG: hypothetical protein PHU51_05880, partial [Candidatus Nanoarchaeia archaeon]|nr:hypothetical protein [Candidatus Nanoarchaeia archaeon]